MDTLDHDCHFGNEGDMRRRQQGMHTVEFAVAGALFMILLFGVIEFGRALFVWNTLAEATRRGAHMAAVCPQGSAAIENAVRFLPELQNNGAVNPSYVYDGLGNIVSVSVTMTGYQFHLMIPFFDKKLTAPDFTSTVSRESLGAGPAPASACQ